MEMLDASTSRKGVEKHAIDDPAATINNNFVTCIYRIKLAEALCTITVTWAKTQISHTLYITVEDPQEEHHYTCRIDLKTWQFWGKKGLKTLRVADKRMDVFWDLRSASFGSSPEPSRGYYVAMVSQEEMVLLLGDQKTEALKRTRSRTRASLEEGRLVHKKEIVFAKKCFCTKTTLGQEMEEHNIMIESVLCGPYDPEMWISVDGIESIRVPNLHWRFRGNETIVVGNNVSVEILWDVHDWLYNGSHSGVGVFVFRRICENYGNESSSSSLGFCHFIYAWMTQ